MGATVLQSLSLKISDVKIVNLEALLNGYRGQVLADITKKNSEIEKLSAYRLGDRLAAKFKAKESELSGVYWELLIFNGQSSDSVAQIMNTLDKDVKTLGISRVNHVAARIVRLDIIRARQLCED